MDAGIRHHGRSLHPQEKWPAFRGPCSLDLTIDADSCQSIDGADAACRRSACQPHFTMQRPCSGKILLHPSDIFIVAALKV